MMNTDSNNLLRNRCDSYRLLAACFYEPQRNIFENATLQNLAASLQDLCPVAADYAEAMIQMLQEYSEEQMLVDYARLFVGPTELLAPPYGSVYLERDARLMGDSTMAAVDFYKAHGLVIDADFQEVPDHIAVELEFMHYLAFKQLEALETGNVSAAVSSLESQEVFMKQFIRPWADDFTSRMAAGAETGFYKALARCLSALIYKTDIRNAQPGNMKSAAVS